MLTYLGRGERRYGTQPFYVQRRECWEFEAVIRGVIAPLYDGTSRPELCASTLWVFAPDVRHGWTGNGDQPSEVLVFHFTSVPEPLASIAGGALQVPLEAAEIRRLVQIADEVQGEVYQPTSKGELVVTRSLHELSLMALKNTPNRPLLDGRAREKALVQTATIWLSEHLAEGPTLEQASDVVHVSPSHLRRLFHRVHKKSPRAVLEELKFQRARGLLENNELTLEVIALGCGYSDASALSRAFRKHCGKPPSAFRRVPR